MKLFVSKWIMAALCFIIGSAIVNAAEMPRPNAKKTATPTGPKIKVLLTKEAPSAFLEARGSYQVVRKDNGAYLSSGKLGKRFVVHALQDGLRWGEEYPDIYQIAIVPTSSETYFLVDGIQYYGSIAIYHARNNHIAIVNELPIEDFVKSTLANRCDEPLLPEAMAAMAIAVRTEAYHKMLEGKNLVRPWHITSEEASYFGAAVHSGQKEIETAVDWTRFMVLESLKHEGPLPNAHLVADKAQELADKGFDAQKILKNTFPQAKIGATIQADEVAIR